MTIDGDDAGKNRPGRQQEEADRGADLDRRRRELDAAISARRPRAEQEEGGPRTGGLAGMGQALRLSSEFIAGIVVGASLGWVIDQLLGTTPWGMIVFLMLGFGAGVLNVLRAVGKVAEFGQKPPEGDGPGKK